MKALRQRAVGRQVCVWLALTVPPAAGPVTAQGDYAALASYRSAAGVCAATDAIVVGRLARAEDRVFLDPLTHAPTHREVQTFAVGSVIRQDPVHTIEQTALVAQWTAAAQRNSRDRRIGTVIPPLDEQKEYLLLLKWVPHFQAYVTLSGISGIYEVQSGHTLVPADRVDPLAKAMASAGLYGLLTEFRAAPACIR